MRRRGLALAALSLLLVGVVATPVAAADPGRARQLSVVAHWTAARLKAAVPRAISATPSQGIVETSTMSATKLQPLVKDGAGGVAAATTAIGGASWTKGGKVLKATGRVYFDMDGGAYVCSGSVVTDARTGFAVVLTAAHCAYDEVNHAFATNWMFIPEFDSAPTLTCADTKWGCWAAQALVVSKGYATANGFDQQASVNDFAFAVVGAGGKSGSQQLDAAVGSFAIAFSGTSVNQKLYAFGYPAAGKYTGNDLTYCSGSIRQDLLNGSKTWAMTCDMTGGSSGGPWFRSFNESTGTGTLASLNSYGYSGLKSMYGPKFNATTQALYAGASGSAGATANTVVP